MPNNSNFIITDETNGNPDLSGLPFNRIKEDILPKEYELSLVFVDNNRSRELNAKYRKKDYPTDILSFPLEENSGEIFICIEKAKKEAPNFGRGINNFILYLFIHGAFHLIGMDHGDVMEEAENKIRKKYKV